MRIFLSVIVVIIAFFQTSCEKSKDDERIARQEAPISLGSILQCNGRTTRDSAAVHNALIGKWKWEFISCYWNPEKANGEDFKTLAVEFKTNDTVEVKVDNMIAQNPFGKLQHLVMEVSA